MTFASDPLFAAFYGGDSPFAALNQVSAEMDHEMRALMRAADQWVPALNAGNAVVSLRTPMPGTSEYVVSTWSGNGKSCTRSLEMTSAGLGKQPKVVSHTSGDCSSNATGYGTVALPRVTEQSATLVTGPQMNQVLPHKEAM